MSCCQLGVQGGGELWVHATGADTSEETELALRNAEFEELGRMTLPWVGHRTPCSCGFRGFCACLGDQDRYVPLGRDMS